MGKPYLYLLVAFFLSMILLSNVTFAKDESYKKTLKKWTRSDVVYRTSDFNAEIQWTATLLNHDMLKAQAKKHKKIYNLSSTEEEDLIEKLSQKKGQDVLFFVSFYSSDRRFNDLSKEGDRWDLRLEVGERRYKPLRIEKIARHPDPLDQLYYSYLNIWSLGYYVWFPSEIEKYPKEWTLSVHGTKARSKLVWK